MAGKRKRRRTGRPTKADMRAAGRKAIKRLRRDARGRWLQRRIGG